MKKKLYTTSEYIDALKLRGNWYDCKGKDFNLYSTKEAADNDAQWLVEFYAKEGKKMKKPVVYRVRFERVKVKK